MRLRVHRTDGKTGRYTQNEEGPVQVLLKRLDPAKLFRSGFLVIGVHNPLNILNPDEVCWIEVETELPTLKTYPADVEQVIMLSGRNEYESELAKQWPQWMKFRKGKKGDLLEAFVEISLRSGEAVFLRVIGRVGTSNIVSDIFGAPAICATFAPYGTVYINPRTITRIRIYHSKDRINYDAGLWMAEADDV